MYEEDKILERNALFKDMESLRERRLAFRRRNTMRNDKHRLSQVPEFVPPTHPVHFQDRE